MRNILIFLELGFWDSYCRLLRLFFQSVFSFLLFNLLLLNRLSRSWLNCVSFLVVIIQLRLFCDTFFGHVGKPTPCRQHGVANTTNIMSVNRHRVGNMTTDIQTNIMSVNQHGAGQPTRPGRSTGPFRLVNQHHAWKPAPCLKTSTVPENQHRACYPAPCWCQILVVKIFTTFKLTPYVCKPTWCRFHTLVARLFFS